MTGINPAGRCFIAFHIEPETILGSDGPEKAALLRLYRRGGEHDRDEYEVCLI
jgi:hypothetical protein